MATKMNLLACIETLKTQMTGNIPLRANYMKRLLKAKQNGLDINDKLPEVITTAVVVIGKNVVEIKGSYAERRGVEYVRLTFTLNGKRSKESEILNLENNDEIETGLTGEDWAPKSSLKYYAQATSLEGSPYAFGSSEEEAKTNLIKIINK